MDIPDILFFSPNRVWRTYPGGKRLDQIEGKKNPDDSHFPEDWIGSTTRALNKGREHLIEEGLSKVTIAGETLPLKTLFEQYPQQLLGAGHFRKYGANTQFLFKLLDSAIRLHLQCHPTIAFAQQYLNSDCGKTEAYVILAIRAEVKEPYIYMGFQHPPEPTEFRRIIEEQDHDAMLACFEKVSIRPGDVFMVPGGMPHAIGEGVFMIEIMEPTDFVVRIEFERGGYKLPEASRFMDRGIDFALSMFNYAETPIDAIRDQYFCKPRLVASQDSSSEYVLIDQDRTPCFRVNRIDVRDRYEKQADDFYIGYVCNGSGQISINGKSWSAEAGTKFFIPHQTDAVVYESVDSMELLVTYPPT